MTAKYVDDNGLDKVSDILSERLATKVEAVSGKGLSEANFTQEEKTKLASMDISAFVIASQKGAANGVASLNSNGIVPNDQLPESDIIKGYYDIISQKFYKESSYTTQIVGNASKLYIDLATPKNYRWDGNAFIEITSSLTLGTNSEQAYPGNLGANNATAIDRLNTSIGSLGTLYTIEKSSIVGAINEIKDSLVFDSVPTENSPNLVTSGVVYDSINFSHNCFFRGKNLGTINASNIDAFITSHGIATGAFNDIYVGDYFTAPYDGTATIFRIAGFNLYMWSGDTELTANHIVVVPDYQLTTSAMNSTSTTANGYKGSNMFTNIIGGSAVTSGVNKKLYDIFGTHLLKYQDLLSTGMSANASSKANSTASGAAASWHACDVYANLMSGSQIFGEAVAASSLYDYGFSTGRFPLFMFEPKYAINRSTSGTRGWYWLKEIYDSTMFAGCNSDGCLSAAVAGNAGGVRPFFLLG